MKRLFAFAAVSLLLAAPAAHAGDAAVEKPIHDLIDGFNKGDIKLAKAAHVAAPSITDEVAPFVWTGPKAFDTWLADLTASETKEGKTDGKVWAGPPLRETVVGDHAYVFTRSTYTFKQGGQTKRESGTFTFVLAKEKTGWKIAAWTWTSPDAKVVK